MGSIPARDHAIMLARFSEQFGGSPGEAPAPFTCNLRDPDGAEREIVYSTFAVEIAGSPHLVAIFDDLTGPRAAGRAAVALALALAQAASQLVGAGTTDEILAGIARQGCRGHAGPDGWDRGGGRGPQAGDGGWLRVPGANQSREAWTAASITLDDLPGGEVLLTGRSVVLPDARLQWETNPVIEGFAATLTGLDWQAGVYVPLSWGNRVFGVLGAYLPAGLAGPSEAELAFYTPRARRESWTRIIHSCSSSAVKHWIICARWQMLSTRDVYSDLGGDYFQRRDPERETQRPIRQLEALGPTPAEPTSTAEAVAAAWRLFPVSGSRTLDSPSALLPTFRIARRRL